MSRTVEALVRRHLVREAVARTADKWKALPKGWTQDSLQRFWDSLTSKAPKRPVTRCIQQMSGKIDDPGAFCAAARDRAEGKGWRSEER